LKESDKIWASCQESLRLPNRFSYAFILLVLILSGWLHTAVLLVAALFSYLALSKLQIRNWPRWLTVVFFVFLMLGAGYALGAFVNHTVRELPEIAENAIPYIIDAAKKHEIQLPFTDYDSLREVALSAVKSQVSYLAGFAKFARGASRELLMALIGAIVAMGIFLRPSFELRKIEHSPPEDLYTACSEQILIRFKRFYGSFATVIGAQIVISAINTVFTTIFVLVVHLPYAFLVIGITFLCGLVPVIGNLISNTVMVSIALTVSPRLALASLIFLVVIHKLEYFLNSKIIGDRINSPLWVTLLALVLGERLLGVPGMILAPVVLNYVRTEASTIPVATIRQPC
jgi:predicted PurR-regulated permease PerM